MYVTDKPEKIDVFFTYDRLVSVLEYMAPTIVSPVVAHGIAGK
jgi:hypothetical protein